MCGIAGILESGHRHEAPFYKMALGRMLSAMQHRGPNDQGEESFTFNGSSLHLGHRRLSIIDLSSLGHQPMANDQKNVWISTNGELYNYRELRDELKHKYTFRSSSDTEVMLRAYEAWGVNCLDRFRGMFAFAIWDANRRVLFMARDHLGIKPLYYHSNPDCFVFASEVRAIQSSGIPGKSIDPIGLYHYLSFGRLQPTQSILTGISELKPAHYMLVEGGKITEKEYWSPLSNTSSITSNIEIQVRIAVEESVRNQMVSDVPLGAFLSGGIDSSAVTGIMSQFHDSPIKTLSIVFAEEEFDESQYSNLIASRFATDHHILRLSETDLLNALPAAIMAMDQPTIDGINTFLISRSAREAGLTVALSGLGGDELFCGYDSFRMVPSLLKAEKLIRSLPVFLQELAGKLAGILTPASDSSLKLAHFLSGNLNGGHVYFLFRALFCNTQLDGLLNADLAATGARHFNEFSLNLLNNIKSLEPVNQISYLELTQYTSNMLLRDTDVMSMANALEVRVPLMDHKLVEFERPEEPKAGGDKKSE